MDRNKEKGDVQIVKMGAWSGGPGCHGGCGVEVHIRNGRVIKVEGDPDHPFLQGRPCPRVLAMPQLIYRPDRLKYPLKRAGERGEGKWTRITWDEAYDIIFGRMKPKASSGGQEVGKPSLPVTFHPRPVVY